MADLITLAGIEAELADTADYDVAVDVAKAKRRAAALRRRLDFPESSGRGEQNIAFAMQAIENQLQQVLAWIAANETPSDASRPANPDVVHAAFSTTSESPLSTTNSFLTTTARRHDVRRRKKKDFC